MANHALTDDESQRLTTVLRSLDLDPHALESAALSAASSTALALGRHDDALALARAAVVGDPRAARAWSLVGAALEATGDVAGARRAYETAVSRDERDLAVALKTAELQARTGSPSAARALVTYVLLRESDDDIRDRARTLLAALEAGAGEQ